jgi:hypothetical protein
MCEDGAGVCVHRRMCTWRSSLLTAKVGQILHFSRMAPQSMLPFSNTESCTCSARACPLCCRLADALNELLPEAFATAREASRRVLGMRHFDSQLVGELL